MTSPTTPETSPGSGPAAVAATPEVVIVTNRKVPVLLTVLTAGLAAMVLFGSQPGDTTFRLAARTDFFELPEITVPSEGTAWVMVAIMALLAGEAWRRHLSRRVTPMWVSIVFAFLAMVGFLAWAASGGTVPVVGLLAGSLALAVPLVFGALGGVLGERAGVVNIAIDGQLLAGAFAAAIVGSITGSTWAGVLGAMLAGALVALVLGLFAISYFVDQIIVGVVLNVLIIGITSFMFSQVLAPHTASLNSPPRFDRLVIPVVGDIPLIGPILFRQTPIVYLLYIAVALVAWALYRTRWGLRVRAVGEHPTAADTVGINVKRTRYRTVILAGAVAGMGGAFYTLVSVQAFNREMTGGAGYIALAAVIFGQWDPIKATLAALLFGFASNLQGVLSVLPGGSPVPSQFMLMLPYVVTIFAVAGLVGRSRAPAADGVAYRKA
ncbi:MAG: ABC transporter permease [Nocardioides sp.]|nr:ABC transporter permease [Nocardioides sp.]